MAWISSCESLFLCLSIAHRVISATLCHPGMALFHSHPPRLAWRTRVSQRVWENSIFMSLKSERLFCFLLLASAQGPLSHTLKCSRLLHKLSSSSSSHSLSSLVLLLHLAKSFVTIFREFDFPLSVTFYPICLSVKSIVGIPLFR